MVEEILADHHDVPPAVPLPILDKFSAPFGTDMSGIPAREAGEAISRLMSGQLTEKQAMDLLRGLHVHKMEHRADVLWECSQAMRRVGALTDMDALKVVIARRQRGEGAYAGGLCDIVGTGGDKHNTFNISTTSSIIASALLLVAKHGNGASTSRSGSADVVAAMTPRAPVITAVTPASLAQVYEATSYAFLFAPVFHPRMRFVAPLRKALPHPTIFNLLGPLANPVEEALDARMIGVRHRSFGPLFADALKGAGARRALVVCGEEELDEVSCAGRTNCWMVGETEPGAGVQIEHFTVHPADFGLACHPLDSVCPGKGPEENAEMMRRILSNELADDNPLLEFVLMNTAALFVVSGICEADRSNMGPGDDGAVVTDRGPAGRRWKEGVRRARWAIKSGEAWRQWQAFVEVTNRLG